MDSVHKAYTLICDILDGKKDDIYLEDVRGYLGQALDDVVIFCSDCTAHNNCAAERIYQSENIEKPFCCRAKREGWTNETD